MKANTGAVVAHKFDEVSNRRKWAGERLVACPNCHGDKDWTGTADDGIKCPVCGFTAKCQAMRALGQQCSLPEGHNGYHCEGNEAW